jgi:hypothetical protein
MAYEALPASAGTAYDDLLTHLLTAPFPARGISYFTREVKGRNYWYMQYKIGSTNRSWYIGRDTEATRRLVKRARGIPVSDQDERAVRERLVQTGVATGLRTPSLAEARVYEALVQTGLFVAGGVMVGSHALLNIGNLLGVRWINGMDRTADIDIAHDPHIDVATPLLDADLEAILREADKAFFAVPALDRKSPSTSYKIRGKELSVSLLTPMHGAPGSQPVPIKPLRTAAAPVRYLDFLLEDSQAAAVPVEAGLLIRVPDPARFALHKLVVSQRRPAAQAAKSRKDIAQAAAVLEVLRDLRPGDIRAAREAAEQHGAKFMQQMRDAAGGLPPDLVKLAGLAG